MKKTITIVSSLVFISFTGSFLISYGLKKTRGLKDSAATNDLNGNRQISAQNTDSTFYNAVGSSPKAASSPVPKQATRFTIELASFNNQTEAESLLMRLKSRGIDGFYTPLRRGGTVIYRVRLGMFANPDDANKVLAKVNSAAQVNGVVAKMQ
ncbi:MAG: SPOR domain-containing protein [bacterium]